MKTHVTALAAGILLLASAGVAAAQTVVIAPEQETVIREYVKSKPVASNLPGVELNIGSTVPDTVELHKIDAPDIAYSYTVVGSRTYVVEPGTRKIVHVIN